MLTFMAIWGQRLLGFTLLGVACAALARWDWRFEWFSHWLPYFTVYLGVGLWCHRSKRVRLGLFVVILWLMASLYWVLFSGNFLEMPVRDKTFRAIAMNVFLHNTNYQASETWLLAQQADVVILTEASSVWQSELSQLQRLMPYGCGKWEDSPFAMVLLAKQPLITCDMVTIDGLFPYVRAVLAHRTVVYGLHPPPPLNEVLALSRNKILAHVAQRIGQGTVPVLVLGDMNSTPYSPWYQDFRQTAGLHEVGFSGWPTWGPWPQGPLILPLDRSLVRGLWATKAIGPALGSDHRAVMVDIH